MRAVAQGIAGTLIFDATPFHAVCATAFAASAAAALLLPL